LPTTDAVEQLTDLPFSQALRTILFDPLKMNITTHDPALAMTYPSAQHHRVGADGHLEVIHRPMVGAKWLAGSQCYSSLRELVTFAAWLLADLRSVTNQTLRIDQAESDLRLDVGTRYGLGCYLSVNANGDPTVGHEGFFEGMWVKVVLDPIRNRGLVWLDNRGDELRDARYELMDSLVPGLLPATFESNVEHEPPTIVTGAYRRLGGPTLTIASRGSDVELQLSGATKRVNYFERGIWRAPAGQESSDAVWRPHAGSQYTCLGVPTTESDDTSVVHLNGLPYVRSRI
jgi:CubicO group peptidase (beta-lactamase class C family)